MNYYTMQFIVGNEDHKQPWINMIYTDDSSDKESLELDIGNRADVKHSTK